MTGYVAKIELGKLKIEEMEKLLKEMNAKLKDQALSLKNFSDEVPLPPRAQVRFLLTSIHLLSNYY